MLKNIIEALLFSAGRGLSHEEIVGFLSEEYTEAEITEVLMQLKQEYSGDRGFILIEYNNNIELQSNPKYGDRIADMLVPVKERELSKVLLETLSIVAYKQPVTRRDIEEIRGVSSDYALSMLLKFDLITIVGRKDALGKPLLYGTTNEFLKRFQLKSLEDLPDYNELLEMIRNKFDRYYGASEHLFRKDLSPELMTQTALDLDEVASSIDNDNDSFIIDDEEIPEFLQQEDIISIE